MLIVTSMPQIAISSFTKKQTIMSTTVQTAPKSVATAFQFLTPANQQDFPDDPKRQAALNSQWNINVNGFTQQGITRDPWNLTNASNITNYINPALTPLPANPVLQQITWNAFPNRISYYFPHLSTNDVFSLADTGYQLDGTTSFPDIKKNPCNGLPAEPKRYGPYGPRGWQDEYCEWAVTKNNSGQITRIDFTCENPEYWNSLWMTDPERVLELYRSILNKTQIQLEDLYLYDQMGKIVIDPSTGRPAYNPLNKWNFGTVSGSSAGGAMHLTATPNTLQTEIGEAAGATSQRSCGNNNSNKLICCDQTGQPHRNSDPNIGQSVNKLVAAQNAVTLANPPGLYIQLPNFSGYQTPDGTDAASFWTVVRGQETLTVDGVTLPGNFILHAVFEVPASKGYTVSDITINGAPIQWAGQIAKTFNMQIVGAAVPQAVPAVQDCCKNTPPESTYAQPLQLLYQDIFTAMADTPVPNPVKEPMALISNSTLIAPLAEQGATNLQMVLLGATVQADPNNAASWPAVTFDNNDITAVITAVASITYATPGNSYPAPATALFLSVNINANAQTGLRNIYITNVGQPQQAPYPAALNVVAPGTISKGGK